jgi:hypothetical protein
VTDLQAAYSRLRVMYVAYIPSDEERNRVKGTLLAYRRAPMSATNFRIVGDPFNTGIVALIRGNVSICRKTDGCQGDLRWGSSGESGGPA